MRSSCRWLCRVVGFLAVSMLLAGAPAPASAARYETLAPIKQIQARRLAMEPMERKQERREFVERARELRRLARQMKKSGRSSARATGARGEKARRDERIESLPLVAAGQAGTAQSFPSGTLTPTNHRANNPSGDTSGDGQCETSLVAWGNFMVAAWNDGTGFHNGTNQFQGYATSVDGGITWTDRGSPPVPASRPSWSWTSDPVLAVNSRTGAFYFSALVDPDGPAGSVNGIGVIKGRFVTGALVWESPSLVRSVDYSTDFLDKQWLAVDPLTAKVYLSYTRFASNISQINFQAADSALVTWSSPALISVQSTNASLDEGGLVQGSRPVVGSDGTVYVMYYRIGLVDVDYYRLAKSTNLGTTFSAPTTIATFYPNFASGGPGFNRAMGIQFASIAADHSGGEFDGRLYLTWAESLNWLDELASLGLSGNKVEVEPNNLFGNATLFTSGQTLRGVLSGLAGEEDWFKIALGAGEHIIFMADSIAGTTSFSMRVFGPDGASRLMYTLASSADVIGNFGPGYSFTAPTAATYFFRVFPASGSGGYRIRTGAAVRTTERGRDQRDVFSSFSNDHGATWSTPVRASASPVGYDDWLPEIAVTADGHVYSAWFDFRDALAATGGAASRIYTARSDDGGVTWPTESITSDASSAWSSVNSNIMPNQGDYNSLFGYDRGVAACWADGRDGDPNAYMALWDAAMRADVTTALATSDSTAQVSWQLTPSTTLTPTVYRRSLPGGAWAALQVLPPASGTTSVIDPTVVRNAQYEYRLGIDVDGRERFYGNVVVTMPIGPTPPALAISGVFPNPVDRSATTAPRVSYRLQGTAPARLELLDITGRLVATYELGSPGSGAYSFNLPAGGDIRPGVYLLRLVQGTHNASRRISILR